MSSTVTLVGNATADPELRFFEGGTAKATFSIAVNRYWTDDSGEKKEQTSFFNIAAWRYLAEDVARVVQKGSRVIVTGKLEQQSWSDKDTNEKKSSIIVTADQIGIGLISIESFERRTGGGAADGAPAPRKAAASAAKKPARPAMSRQDIPEDEEAF
jgi:single-strand DNA-binding protein